MALLIRCYLYARFICKLVKYHKCQLLLSNNEWFPDTPTLAIRTKACAPIQTCRVREVSVNLNVSVLKFGIDSSVSGPSEWQEVKMCCITKFRVREASAGTMEKREGIERVGSRCPERTRARSSEEVWIKCSACGTIKTIKSQVYSVELLDLQWSRLCRSSSVLSELSIHFLSSRLTSAKLSKDPRFLKSDVSANESKDPRFLKSDVSANESKDPRFLKSDVSANESKDPRFLKSDVSANESNAARFLKSEVSANESKDPRFLKSEVSAKESNEPRFLKSDVSANESKAARFKAARRSSSESNRRCGLAILWPLAAGAATIGSGVGCAGVFSS